MQSVLFSPRIRDDPGAETNPELCSLTLWGQLRLLQEVTKSAAGSRDGWCVDR